MKNNIRIPSKNEVSLRLIKLYIKHIEELFADDPKDAENLLMVLQCYKHSLLRRSKPHAVDFDWLWLLKHNLRQAENILVEILEDGPDLMAGWFMGRKATNPAQHLSNVLTELILEFTKEIVQTEAMFPELKPAFDRERSEYRRMKEEAEEAQRYEQT
jgi:hypothetical protein